MEQWMALVNEGLRILQDDVMRARYLATGSATVSETGQKMETGFLETIFELQTCDERSGSSSSRSQRHASNL